MAQMRALALLGAGVLAAPAALAQTAPLPAPPPAGSPIERMLPRQVPSVSPGGLMPGALNPNEVQAIAVPVRRIDVVGATLFPDVARSYVAGLTGPAVSTVALNEARQKILLYYRSRGYALCAVNLSIDRDSGTVRYQITEGRIAAVKLDGDIGPAGTMVLRFLNRLTEYPVIDTLTLERYLLLAQDVPGVSVSTVITPSETDPGALILIAQVGIHHVTGQVSLDNRAYQFTGPWEMLGVFDFNSYTSFGEKTEIALFHSFPNSQNFGQIFSEWFIGSDGAKLRVYGGAGTNAPTGPLGAINYHSFTDVFGIQVSYPLIRTRRQNLNIYTSFDGLEETIDQAGQQSGADEVRVLRAGADYTLSDVLAGGGRPATNQVSVRLSQGLEALGGYHGQSSPPSTARQNEQHNFFAVRFEATRTQTLMELWPGATLALMGLITGQWTTAVLPPAEQFYLGGSRFTRGFYAGQEPGDKALAATAELQLNTSIDLSSFGTSAEIATQFYLFYDWGETWQNLSTDPQARLNSAGGGARIQITRYVEWDVEALARLTKRPPINYDLNGIGLYTRLVGRF